MKKAKIALIMSASCLLALGMASCGGHSAASSVLDSVTSSTSQGATVTKITAPNIPLVKVGAELDLDTVIIVTTSDGATTSKDYTVTCSNTAVTLTGHVFKSTAPGSIELVVTAGGKSIKPTIEVKTETGIGLINFFKNVDLTPQNYTISELDYNSTSKSLVYGNETIFHNEKYIAAYNINEPGSVSSTGKANSIILATLSDGKAYWGNVDATGKAVFKQPSVTFGQYYITGDLSVDGSAFVSTIDDAGNETILGGSAITTAFIESAFGNSADDLTDTSGNALAVGDTEVLGFTDANKDGVYEDITLGCYLTKTTTDDALFAFFTISDVGTTKSSIVEAALTDASYVPAVINAPELVTSFAAAATAANYTTEIKAYASDSNGNPVATATVAAAAAKYGYCWLMGTDGLGFDMKSTITADGVYSEIDTVTYAAKSETDATIVGTSAFGSKAAFFNRNSQAYQMSYSTKTAAATTTAISGVTDVWTSTSAKAMTVSGVTAAAINSQQWTSNKTDATSGLVTIAGTVGDDTKTGKTDTLFAQMFDQFRFYSWTDLNDGKTADHLGTFLANYSDWSADSSGNYHALACQSNWTFIVNPKTNEISCKTLFYMPTGRANPYFVLEYTVSAVGTTTNDFSAYVPASTATSSSSALA